jgi:xylan 1,4-beta-xylosidase
MHIGESIVAAWKRCAGRGLAPDSIAPAKSYTCALFALMIGLAITTSFCVAQTTGSMRAITVDAGKTMGQLKPFRGVSGPPDTTSLPKEMERPPSLVRHNISSGYRSASVNLIRTHDSNGAADIDPTTGPLEPLKGGFGPPNGQAKGPNLADLLVIFPNPAADPNDPRSYNWGPTDRLLASIHDIGADVLFRLGREGQTTAPPPTDLVKYASIVRHIVLHYNKGWDNGFENRVRYWEIWNEPDLGLIWWRGNPEQYYAMYAAFAGAVKEADPNSLVGGPTIAMVNEANPYREGFLAYARDHKLPLDFYSWHWYSAGSDPYDFVRLGFLMRQLLDSYGFTKTLSFSTSGMTLSAA